MVGGGGVGVGGAIMNAREILVFFDLWNSHRLRKKQEDVALPESIPNHIYNFPEDYGLDNCCMFHFDTVLLSSKCCTV